jgi:hypothetical protein
VSGVPVCVLSGRALHDQTTHRQLATTRTSSSQTHVSQNGRGFNRVRSHGKKKLAEEAGNGQHVFSARSVNTLGRQGSNEY